MLVCRNSLPPSKGHVSASNWLKLTHTQNSSFKTKGVWETCFQLSSSHTRAGPERRGEWILSDSPLYASLCACICARACMCTVYLFACVCIYACQLHVYMCVHAYVHVYTRVMGHTQLEKQQTLKTRRRRHYQRSRHKYFFCEDLDQSF